MKLLYLRNAPYKPEICFYNMQEIGLCKALASYGWNCDILYYSDVNKNECILKDEQNRVAVNILWRKGWKICRTGIYPSILRRAFLSQYDLIISTEYSQVMSVLVSLLAKKVMLYSGPYYNLFKIPVIGKLYDALFVNLLNTNIRQIFCQSQLALEYLKHKGYSKLSVLGVGLDISRYEFVEMQLATRKLQDYFLKNDCLLFVGSLEERKNFPFLLELFASIKQSDVGKNLKLVLIGNGKDAYVKKKLANISQVLREDILRVKKMDNAQLKFIYPFAKCLLLPSKEEIFGMVLLEAMFFGCVPITSKNGGSTTLIRDGENGYVVDSFDVVKWTCRLKEILKDDKKRKLVSEIAQKTISENFTWKLLAKKILNVYGEN